MKFPSKQTLSLAISRLMALCLTAFGSFRWTPPAWWQRLKTTLLLAARRNPKRTLRVVGTIALALVAVGAGSWWWSTRPVPQYCSVKIQSPYQPDTVTKQSSRLLVMFGCSAAQMNEISKTPQKTPELDPAMPGTWTWENDRNLLFIPKVASFDKDWKSGEEYTLSLPRGLVASHVQLETRSLSFKPVELNLQLSEFQFNVDARNPALRRVSGIISSNWPLNPESLRKKLTLSFERSGGILGASSSSNLPVVMTFNPTYTQVYVSTENLTVPEYGSIVRLVGKGRIELASGGHADIDIKGTGEVPGKKGSFKITEPHVIYARNERFEPEQALVVTTNL
ncbi:MAG: hypothetical protein ABIR96_11815, partial [Bdellovibrionota bacterium]